MPDVTVDLTRFTPTERRIVALLADGFAHRHAEIKVLLYDELAEDGAVKLHVHRIRKKLPPHLGILCYGSNGTTAYGMVRYTGTSES